MRFPLLGGLLLLVVAPAGLPVTFTDWTADPAHGLYLPDDLYEAVAWTDADGDGTLDLYLSVLSKDNLLFLQPPDGSGVFVEDAAARGCSDPSTTLGGFGAIFADLDNDGDPDLYLSNGLVDLSLGGLAQANRLLENLGKGRFQDITASSGLGQVPSGRTCVFADYDLDGFLDVFCAVPYQLGAGRKDRLFHNEFRTTGQLVFSDVTSPLLTGTSGGPCGDFDPNYNGVGAAWQDYDKDGDPDLVVANHGFVNLCQLLGIDCEENWIFRNLVVENGGVPGFASVGCQVGITDPEPSFGGSWGDYNNDGWPDLYITNGVDLQGLFRSDAPNTLYRNNGDGTFTRMPESTGVADPSLSFSSSWGDTDNDGWLDLYVVNAFVFGSQSPQDRLFRNEGDGTFTDRALQSGIQDDGWGQGCAMGDWNRDGFLDIFVANYKNTTNPGSHLWTNSADNGNHWLHLDLEGVETNRDAVGAGVAIESASQPLQYREVTAGNGYLTQDSLLTEFGLGADTIVRRVEIRWPVPAGCIQTVCDVAADQVLPVLQDCDDPLAADAGPDRDAGIGEPVALGGSPTSAGGSCPLDIAWDCIPTATLDLSDPAHPLFSAPAMGDYTCTVTVTDSLGSVATDAIVIRVAADLLWVHRSAWDAATPSPPPSLFPCPEYEAIPAGNTTWTESQAVVGDPAARVAFYDVHLRGVPDPDPQNPPQTIRVSRTGGGTGNAVEIGWP